MTIITLEWSVLSVKLTCPLQACRNHAHDTDGRGPRPPLRAESRPAPQARASKPSTSECHSFWRQGFKEVAKGKRGR